MWPNNESIVYHAFSGTPPTPLYLHHINPPLLRELNHHKFNITIFGVRKFNIPHIDIYLIRAKLTTNEYYVVYSIQSQCRAERYQVKNVLGYLARARLEPGR